MCPAKGTWSAKCGKRGHRTACERYEPDRKGNFGKIGGRTCESGGWRSGGATSGCNLKPRGQQINQVDCDSEEEPFVFPLNFNGEKFCEDYTVTMKMNGTVTEGCSLTSEYSPLCLVSSSFTT